MWSVWLERPFANTIVAIKPKLHVGQPTRRELPLPNSHWIRVENMLAGISERDLTLVNGEEQGLAATITPFPRRRYLGREVIGRVVEIGSDVSLVHVGDRIVLYGDAISSCATLGLQPACRACSAGNVGLCEHRTLPWIGTGAGWSDSMIVHETQVFPVPEQLTNDQSILLEPAARTIRGVLQHPPEPGANVLIIGGGTLGLLTIATLQAIAPGTHIILASDRGYETEIAAQYGLATFAPEDTKELVLHGAELTNSQIFRQFGKTYVLGGFDNIFDCRGTKSSLEAATQLARGGGTIVMVADPKMSQLAIDFSSLMLEEVTITGISSSGAEMLPEDMAKSVGARSSTLMVAARLIMQGKLNVNQIITHREPHRSIRHAIAIAQKPEHYRALRVAITFDT